MGLRFGRGVLREIYFAGPNRVWRAYIEDFNLNNALIHPTSKPCTKLIPVVGEILFLGIISGWNSSVCKSNRLHVDILWFSFIKLWYILYIPLKWPVIFLQSWTWTGYFSNSTGSFVTKCGFSDHVHPPRMILLLCLLLHWTPELCMPPSHLTLPNNQILF